MSKMFTINEIANQLKVNRRTVIRWIRDGELKGFKLGGRRRLWRVKERDLQRFINKEARP